MTLLNTLSTCDGIANFLPSKALIKTVKVLVCGIMVFLISGCSKPAEVSRLKIEIWQNGAPISCERFEHNQQQWLIRQLAFFVSDLTFHSQSQAIKPELIDSPWQTAGVTLVKPRLIDCNKPKEGGNPPVLGKPKSNHWLTFSAPVDVAASDTLSFTLAVPFSLNHQNPLLQASPLNLPSMFWSWRAGHKFLRVDLQAQDKNWVFHLGSVGCASASTMRAPKNECVQPNRLSFQLAKLHSGTKLVLHLDRLVQGTTLETSQSCLFHDGQASCQILLENLRQQDVFEWH